MAADPVRQENLATLREAKTGQGANVPPVTTKTKKSALRGLVVLVVGGFIADVVYNLAQMLGPTTPAGGICWLVGLVMIGLLCKWAF
ncbi:MAG TPA: hypothetical protein VFE42_04875 [Chloroflexota bacterium]|nr:hypothetical protein [Chloroflexota bacterium]